MASLSLAYGDMRFTQLGFGEIVAFVMTMNRDEDSHIWN